LKMLAPETLLHSVHRARRLRVVLIHASPHRPFERRAHPAEVLPRTVPLQRICPLRSAADLTLGSL